MLRRKEKKYYAFEYTKSVLRTTEDKKYQHRQTLRPIMLLTCSNYSQPMLFHEKMISEGTIILPIDHGTMKSTHSAHILTNFTMKEGPTQLKA